MQNLLFAIGATSAALTFAVGIAFLMGLIVFPSDRDSGGAVVAFMILAAVGGVVGGITGFVVATRRIAERRTIPWSIGIWVGLVAGLLSGWWIVMSNLLDSIVPGSLLKWPPATIVFLIAMAFVGGSVGKFVTIRARQVASPPRDKRY